MSATTDLTDWTTLGAAAREYGLPASMIEPAVLTGRLSTRAVCGELLLRRDELQAMRLRLMAERGCDACEE